MSWPTYITHDEPMKSASCECDVKHPSETVGDKVEARPVAEMMPPMPSTADRRPYDDENPDCYLESNRDWANNNDEAVAWLADNHKSIRDALAQAEATIAEKDAEIARLRTALAFYAQAENWSDAAFRQTGPSEVILDPSTAVKDGGQVARTAIKEPEHD